MISRLWCLKIFDMSYQKAWRGKWFSGLWNIAYFEGKRTALVDLCFSCLRNRISYCWGYIPQSFLLKCMRKGIPHSGDLSHLWHERSRLLRDVRCTISHFSHHLDRKTAISGVPITPFSEVELVCGKGTGPKHGCVPQFQVEWETAAGPCSACLPPFTQSWRAGLPLVLRRLTHRTKAHLISEQSRLYYQYHSAFRAPAGHW